MGGKTSTSTSAVSIPPEVLARYNSVNATAQDVAQTPFQQYSTNPNAFVAPLDPTQQAGVANTNAAVGTAQPYYNAATGFALAGSQPINAQPLNTGAYMNPYLQTVLGSTAAQINQNNQQAMSGATGNAMSQGYFGGDRSGIASAVLQGQQNLAAGQVYSGIASDAYNQAMAAAQQQQGVNLGAAQANRAATQQTGDTLAGLGTTAQSTALAGAQAQLGAGQVQQQTEQAGLTALYNQFLQQQSYPFQTAQFLANIAEGTGALSGNTTTTTQPGGLFSDERLKEDMEPIGKGFDGANIYRFRYRGDPTTRIGFSAQEMERRHPEAVQNVGGFKAIEHHAATEDAARRGGFAMAANDDWDEVEEPRRARQMGGMSQWGAYPPGVNPMSIGELLQAQAQMYGPGFEGAGLYGGSSSGMPHGGSSYVPAPMGGSPMMIHGTQPPTAPRTTAADALHSAAGLSGDVTGLQNDYKDVKGGWNWLNENVGSGSVGGSGTPFDASVAARRQAQMREPDPSGADQPVFAHGGFIRAHRQDGGGFDPSDPNNDNPYGAKGPGLNIPTQPEQHQQLQGTKPPAQGPSGASQLLGAGADVASIAKAAPELGSMASGIGSGISGALGGIGSALGLGGAGAAAAGAGAAGAGIGAGIGAGASGMASLLPFLMLANRGGRVPRADGGDTELDIPDDKSEVVPLEPAKPPSQGSGDSTMNDIMDIAKIAQMAASFAARGGRIGRAGGGGFSAGDAIEDALSGANVEGPDPVENMLLRRFAQRQATPPDLGDGDADAAPDPAAGPPAPSTPPAAPKAGFAGASPPKAKAAAALASGFAPAAGGVLGNIQHLEGTGQNPHSSAVGPGQFIRSTFIRMARKVFPELASKSDAEIGAMHGTEAGNQMQQQMIPALDAENASALQAAGFPPTPANRHLAWVLGPGGAKKVLGADPSTPLIGLVGQQVVSANSRIMAGKTAGDIINWAAKGMNKGGFAGARHGYQTDGLVVDPDSAVDPSAGQDDSDRRRLDAAPQVDPAMIEQAKQAANDPAVVAMAQQNRAAAAQGAPAPPAAQAAVNNGQQVNNGPQANKLAGNDPNPMAGPGGYQLADRSQGAGAPAAPTPGGGNYVTNAQDASQLATDRANSIIQGQTEHPQRHGLAGLWDWASQPEHAIPMITGIADMLAAPTKYPLVAITQGMKGGAQAYQQQRAYDAQTAMQEQERAQLGVGEATNAYQGATQRRQVNAQIAGQMLNAFDSQYVQQPGMQSEDQSGPKWLGPRGYITNSQHAALRQQIIQGTYPQATEGGNPMAAAPLITASAVGTNNAPVGTVSGQGGNAVGSPAGGAGGGGPGAGQGLVPPSAPPGSPGAVQPPPGVGSGTAGGGGGGPPVAGPPQAPPTGGHPAATAGGRGGPSAAAGSDPIDARFRRGAYGNPVQLPPQMTPAEAATQLQPQYNPYLLQQTGQDAQAQAIFAGTSPAWKTDGTEYTGFRQRAAAQTRFDAATGDAATEWTKRQGMSREFTQGALTQQQYIDTLKGLYSGAYFNVASPELARLIGTAASLPWVQSQPWFTKAMQTWQGTEASAAKMTAAQQLLAAAASHGAPASTLGVAATALPGPDQPPDARYSILYQQQAQLLQQEAKQQAEAKYGGSISNWAQFDADFMRAHPLAEYEAKVHMPFFDKQSMESKVQHSFVPTAAEYKQLKPGDPYVKVVHGQRVIALKGQGGG